MVKILVLAFALSYVSTGKTFDGDARNSLGKFDGHLNTLLKVKQNKSTVALIPLYKATRKYQWILAGIDDHCVRKT